MKKFFKYVLFLMCLSLLINNVNTTYANNNFIKQNTFSNREYKYYNENNSIKVDIKRKNDKKNNIIQTNANKEYIINFTTLVETINYKEKSIIFTVILGIILSIISFIYFGRFFATIITLITIAIICNFFVDLNRAINDADYYFYKIMI